MLIYRINNKTAETENANLIKDEALREFTNKVDETLSLDDKKQPDYAKYQQYIDQMEKSTTPEDKYTNYVEAIKYLQGIYSMTNHDYLYNLITVESSAFAKKEYPDQYTEGPYLYPCQDATCSTNEQPQEILSIVEELKNSDISTDAKKYIVQDILNTGYANYDDHNFAMFYLMTVNALEGIPEEESPSGDNIIIANKLRAYVQKRYPNEYEYLNEAYERAIQNRLEHENETLVQ